MLLSEELIGNKVWIVVGANVLFITAVGNEVALLAFGAEVVNSLGAEVVNSLASGPRVASTKQKKRRSEQ